jgi:ferric iron reductase protein FhuF
MAKWSIKEMCEALVSADTQGNMRRRRKCQRKKMPGSEYCSIHQPKKG